MQIEDFERLPVTVRLVGEIVRDDNWTCDEWAVTFKNGEWRTSYFTGTGLRAKPKTRWDLPRPVKPKIRDIMECLLMDAEAGNMGFSEWCSHYGYDNDSLKALNTYRQCEDTLGHLLRVFSRVELEAMRQAIEEDNNG
jgi:hypothetical protein